MLLRRRHHSYDRIDQRSRRERFGQIGRASRFERGCSRRPAIVSGDKNDWKDNAGTSQPVPDINSRHIIQMDVQDDTKRLIKVLMALKCFS